MKRFDDKKALLKIIFGTATDENITKFKWLAHVVTILLILNLFFIFFVKYFTNSIPITVDGKFVFNFISTIVLVYQIYQFKMGELFQVFAGLWAGYNITLIKNISGYELLFAIIILTFIIGLLFFYTNKMFPKIRLFGYKKDEKGEYIL